LDFTSGTVQVTFIYSNTGYLRFIVLWTAYKFHLVNITLYVSFVGGLVIFDIRNFKNIPGHCTLHPMVVRIINICEHFKHYGAHY